MSCVPVVVWVGIAISSFNLSKKTSKCQFIYLNFAQQIMLLHSTEVCLRAFYLDVHLATDRRTHCLQQSSTT